MKRKFNPGDEITNVVVTVQKTVTVKESYYVPSGLSDDEIIGAINDTLNQAIFNDDLRVELSSDTAIPTTDMNTIEGRVLNLESKNEMVVDENGDIVDALESY